MTKILIMDIIRKVVKYFFFSSTPKTKKNILKRSCAYFSINFQVFLKTRVSPPSVIRSLGKSWNGVIKYNPGRSLMQFSSNYWTVALVLSSNWRFTRCDQDVMFSCARKRAKSEISENRHETASSTKSPVPTQYSTTHTNTLILDNNWETDIYCKLHTFVPQVIRRIIAMNNETHERGQVSNEREILTDKRK